MATIITKSVSVSDICIKSATSSAKTCSPAVTGDTTYVESYSIEGTSGGTACCSSTTDLCMNAWIGCPLVFDTITWKDTITEDGVTYTLKSSISGSSTSTATYQASNELSSPTITSYTQTYNDLYIKFKNDNSITVVCYYMIDPTTAPKSASDIIKGSHYTETVDANSTSDAIEIGWDEDSSSSIIYACFVAQAAATGYEDSGVSSQRFNRPATTQLAAPTLTGEDNDHTSYSVKITNPNNVDCTFYSQDLTDYGGSVDISANSSTEVTLTWGTTATSHTVKGYLSASGYKDSSNGSVTIYRPEDTKYTLTVNYYISGVASGTKYYELGGSEFVYISHYQESISGCTFSYSNPSSGFYMNNSNKTLNMYYIKQLTSPTYEEGNKDFYQYTIYVTNPNDVDCDFYSQDLSDYGGSVIIKAGATKQIDLSWGSGATSHTFSGYLSATNYADSTTKTITIDRPSITSLVKPTLVVQNESTNDFDLFIYNKNEVEVKYYYGYTDTPTTYGGTISKESSATLDVAKTTNKTMWVKFVYNTISSQDSVSVPYIEQTTQLTAPVLEEGQRTYTNYSIRVTNNNDVDCEFYSQDLSEYGGSITVPSKTTKEFDLTWGTTATSHTVKGYLSASGYDNSDDGSVTVYRDKLQLPTPKLTLKSNSYTSYTITFTNTSSLYSVYPFFEGKTHDLLEPNGTVDYTYNWNDSETSKSFTAQSAPTDTSLYTISESATINIDRPATLTNPTITVEESSYTATTLNITNKNSVMVIYYVDNKQIGTIESGKSTTYTYTWTGMATSHTLNIKVVDPTGQYGENSTTYEITRDKEQLTAPVLEEGQRTYTNYSIRVTNNNDVDCEFYSQDLSEYGGSITVPSKTTKEFDLTWGTTATSHTVKGYLSASGYKDSSNGSVTIYRPEDTKYTLTVNYYISGVASGTKYYELGGSEFVYISHYQESISGCTFSYSNPSSGFYMNNSNKTLNMYYIKQLTSPTYEEGNKDFYQYTIYVTNPNDVDCDFYSQDLSDYGGSVIIKAGATKQIDLSWGSGATSHTFSGYLSATNYADSTTKTITIDRPSITSLVKPTLVVQNESTNDFDLFIYNKNEVEVKYYYGYTDTPTTYGGTISKESSATLDVAKTTNKTMWVKFVYNTISSQDSVSVPYIEQTTQLTAPIITENTEKTTNAVYYYTIKNTNDIATSVYINGVKQEKLLESNSEREYSGTWSSGAVSITIIAKLGTLSSSYTDSNEVSLEFDRPKIKLPNPTLTIKTNTHNKYSFTYQNKSSLYTVQPFFNGSSQGDVLEPNGTRDYEFEWGTGETSKTFYCYAMPTGDTTQFTSSDRVELKITRPATLTIPEITNVAQTETGITLTIYNPNDTTVLWFVNNVQQTGSIYNKSTGTYTYTWGDGETEKTFEIKFKDPTSQYGDSNVITKTIQKEVATLLDPVLTSVVSTTNYTITITNKNEEPTVTYYVDGVSKGTIAYNESKIYTAEWGSEEKTKTLVIKFTANNYEDSTKSITVDRPGVITIATPNLSLIENTTKSYKIRISNPNTTTGTYYVVDSNKQKIDNISFGAGEDYDYEQTWGEEETSKRFSCGLMYVNGETTIYSEIATLETFDRPLSALNKPILSENTNNYDTSKFNVTSDNEVDVTWLVNGSQQSTVISKGKTSVFSYDWQDNEKTKRFTVKFTATNYDPSVSYIDLTRPNKLVAPIVELLANDHDIYKLRIRNRNNVAVSLNGGTQIIAANSKLIIDRTWNDSETSKTLTYYFKADGYGTSESLTITFNRMNDDDFYVLFLNIDGEVYKVGGKYTLPIATDEVLGGVKLGYTNSGKNYKIQKDTNGNIFVNVPWTDHEYSLPTASSSNKGGVKVSGNDGVYMDGENLKAKVDNNTIQVGTSGLETKIDGTTIVKGTNGLQAKQVLVTVNDTTKDILIEIK